MAENKNKNDCPCASLVSARGFTLLEIMIVVSVFAIIIGVGVPMISGMVTGRRIDADFDAFKQSLSTARTLAITRKTYVSLCPLKEPDSDDCYSGATYSDDSEVNTGWKNGWMIYTERSRPNNYNIDIDTEKVFQRISFLGGGNDYILMISGFYSHFRFNPRGDSSVNTTISFCPLDPSLKNRYAREIVLYNGRLRFNGGDDTGCPGP